MSDSYVCSKARIKCSCGDKIATLIVYPDRTIWLTGQPQANISDHIPMKNVPPFGRCHTVVYPPTGAATAAAHGRLTPMPCMPNTPLPWMGGKNDVILKGQPALLKSSTLRCIYGGTITITYDGQSENYANDDIKEPKESINDLQEQSEQISNVDQDSVLDGIQMALDLAGFVPVFGAVADLTNSAIYALRGDWINAGISLIAAVPGIGDAAAASKLAYKGYKIASKTAKLEKTSKIRNIQDAASKNNITNINEVRKIDNGNCKIKSNNKIHEKDNVVYIKRKKLKQANGQDVEEITYESSSNSIKNESVNSIPPVPRVERVEPVPPATNQQPGNDLLFKQGNPGGKPGGNLGKKGQNNKGQQGENTPEKSNEKKGTGQKLNYMA